MTIPVDVPRCSYCFREKGQPHSAHCTRPGLKAEIAALARAKEGVLFSAARCRTCGTLLVDTTPGDGVWRCPSDWCPSTSKERKAKEVGESLGTGLAFALVWTVRIVKSAVAFTLLWLAWRAWRGEL